MFRIGIHAVQTPEGNPDQEQPDEHKGGGGDPVPGGLKGADKILGSHPSDYCKRAEKHDPDSGNKQPKDQGSRR